MKAYLSLTGLATAFGMDVRNLTSPPAPDVVIGRWWRGWAPERVLDGAAAPRRNPPWRLLGIDDIAQALGIKKQTVQRMRDLGPGRHVPFPKPAARIENAEHGGGPDRARRPGGGFDGCVYGWRPKDIADYAAATGRAGAGLKGNRGRRAGTGDYAALPRCGRARTQSRHGGGKPCQAVRRKVDGQWAPACGLHLTGQERASLGL